MREQFVKEIDFERLRALARSKANKGKVEVPPEVASLLQGGAQGMEVDDKLGQLQMNASAQEEEFQKRMEAVGQGQDDSVPKIKGVDNSRRAFYREFRKVVESLTEITRKNKL
eukprot:TRINITY_DN10681_c0_g2_i3.p3 TRINITY_DN10681_c0_g2~~TRINITY_DN10681_c0_g2_i3.p3  ORF type:complete len:113 (-),score=30.27 TRINITY_DN10681_c0_g2_i3:16-354(-)